MLMRIRGFTALLRLPTALFIGVDRGFFPAEG